MHTISGTLFSIEEERYIDTQINEPGIRVRVDEMMLADSLRKAEGTAIQPSLSSDHDLRVACFCEENAWRVVYRHLHLTDMMNERRNTITNYYVVFVSNRRKCCPFFQQRAEPKPDGSSKKMEYVCWDYHVIVIRCINNTEDDYGEGEGTVKKVKTKTEVLDIDTWLPYPCPIDEYLAGSFPHAMNSNPQCDPEYLPFFRVVSAQNYLKYFYSDRMHMYNKERGEWLAQPPNYAPIMNGLSMDDTKQSDGDEDSSSNKSNLDMYINMEQSKDDGCDDLLEERMGKVYSLEQFRTTFGSR